MHAQPDNAVVENDALVDVYDAMVNMWSLEVSRCTPVKLLLFNRFVFMSYFLQDFIIGGDLNAACDYVGDDDWANIRLRTDDRFQWVIGDDVNTRTRTDYVCAYDRCHDECMFDITPARHYCMCA